MNNLVDLSAMLAEPNAAGVFYIDNSGREAVVDAVQRLEFVLATIDLNGVSDKDSALSRIAATLRFPNWFGHNWDALSDSLNDLSWLPSQGYVLLLDHAAAWQQTDPAGFDTLLDVVNEVSARWAEFAIPFWLLILAPAGEIAAANESASI